MHVELKYVLERTTNVGLTNAYAYETMIPTNAGVNKQVLHNSYHEKCFTVNNTNLNNTSYSTREDKMRNVVINCNCMRFIPNSMHLTRNWNLFGREFSVLGLPIVNELAYSQFR